MINNKNILRALLIGFGVFSPIAAVACQDWNTIEFFDVATPEQIYSCIESGMDVNARDGEGITPLHYASAYNENSEIVLILIDLGALVNARDLEGFTPLHAAAAFNDNLEVLLVLISEGADINAQAQQAYTPLHAAAEWSDNPDIIVSLLRAGANGAIRTIGTLRSESDLTPFDMIGEDSPLYRTQAYWMLNDARYP
jgi:hypothetical protein